MEAIAHERPAYLVKVTFSAMFGTRPRRQARALVVSHEASRTGAPRVAIEVTRALSAAGWKVEVCVRWVGPLEEELAEVADRLHREPLRRIRVALRRWRPTRRLAAYVEQLAALSLIARQRPDLVWCNSVLSACYIRPACWLSASAVLHSHEPEERARQVLRRYKLQRYWDRTVLVGCGPTTATVLAEVVGTDPRKARSIPSVPDADRIEALAAASPEPEYGLIVGACGTPTKDKGVDLWVAIAAQVAKSVPALDIRFLWIGGPVPPGLRESMDEPELSGRVTFTGEIENPYPLLKAVDVFVLSSRSDRFPLVVLEAMALSRAVVAFDSGDVRYQLGDPDHVHPVGAIAQAADDIVRFLKDPAGRAEAGERNHDRVSEVFSIDGFRSAVVDIASRSLADQRL